MNVTCDSCSARYAVPDTKVRGKKVRMTCKKCGAAIIIDGRKIGADSGGSGGKRKSVAPKSVAPKSVAPKSVAPKSAANKVEPKAKSSTAPTPAKTPKAVSPKVEAPKAASPKVESPSAAPRPAVAPRPGGLGGGLAGKQDPKPRVGALSNKPEVKALGGVLGGKKEDEATKQIPKVEKPDEASTQILDGVQGDGDKTKAVEPFKEPAARNISKSTMLGGLQAPQAAGKMPTAQRKAAKQTLLGGVGAPGMSPMVRPAAKTPLPTAPTAPKEPEREWTVAVTDDDHYEMSTEEVVQAYQQKTIDQETFIWKEGMDDWLTPFEIPDIAVGLKAAGAQPDDSDFDDVTMSAPSPLDAQKAGEELVGEWNEPGSWKPGDVGGAKVAAPAPDVGMNFDDVTVAMAAPQSRKLIQESLTKAEDAAAAAAAAKPSPGADAPRPRVPSEPEIREPALDLPDAGAAPFAAADAPDLFAGSASAGSEEEALAEAEPVSVDVSSEETEADESGDKPTGARGESSVLFSLDNLKSPDRPAPKPSAKATLLGMAPPSPPSPGKSTDADAPPDSLINMGAGGDLFGSPDVSAPPDEAAFAAPTSDALAAAAPEPEPEPIDFGDELAPKKKGGSGLLIVLLLLLLVVGAGGAYAYLNKLGPFAEAPKQATPTSQPSKESATATTSPEPEEATDAPADAGGSDEDAKADAEASAKPDSTAAQEKPEKVPGPLVEEKKDEPEDEKKEEPEEEKEEAKEESDLPPFNVSAARAALSSAAGSASGCKKPDGPTGKGRATVTFAPSGRVTSAVVTGAFAGTSVGGCVARIFRGATVPPFSGPPKSVGKSFFIN